MFDLSLTGAQASAERFDDLTGAVTAALLAKARSLAEQLRLHVVEDKLSGQVLHERTGALKASIQAEVAVDGAVIRTRVFSAGDLKYALIQEYGGQTAAHDILPNKAQALAFLVGGRQVFAKIVHHPGSRIPERSYLRSSLNDMAETIAADLKAAALDAF